ncbi:serine carboxypeptidase S28-domain-containing protein [Dunaliella salina]|uniref:Serine carboxypeptidase S28-domain-containing protein n=1 Tax=Dunaliella salina TaxID=3046 RepID=A0ABQ7H9U8_DUNSA|nr:serine carboxypeptidase S28-domain-containing protein [Dunaliella salina]|eukprot:KAF5843628.1 serine carboxypeptidase S28-domain-containing protein [Dunaliella salina]
MQRVSRPCSYLLRYYGKSQPFGPESWKVDPRFLSVPQALADYACIIQYIKQAPVIVFGGSYGGELAAWMRLKYPHIVAGAIAASAPVLGYPDEPGFRPSAYWKVEAAASPENAVSLAAHIPHIQTVAYKHIVHDEQVIVTRDATPAAGAAPGCSSRVRQAFQALMQSAAGDPVVDPVLAQSAAGGPVVGPASFFKVCIMTCAQMSAFQTQMQSAIGGYLLEGECHYLFWDRAVVTSRLRLCSPLAKREDITRVAYWLQGAFDAYAMGNYPYPSSYVTQDANPLPAWPMRAACQLMTQEGKHVLESMADAVGLLYNLCMAQEQPYWPANGKTDMFWDQGPYNFTAVSDHCMKAWGLRPDRAWPTVQLGGLQALKQASNIVFSNGEFDPWSAFGILSDLISNKVHAVFIKEGAHHLDLMWSNPADPPSVRSARDYEMQHIAAWIEEYKGAS